MYVSLIVEEAGGKCLPCVMDIRYEDQVSKAVDQAAQKFGGIDILVNNASAISLTGTVGTDMKKYVYTYMCSTILSFVLSSLPLFCMFNLFVIIPGLLICNILLFI